jgi:hypothetical protein
MDALMLDGNAVASLLQEVFAVEMTTATVSCNACGRTEAVGAPRISRRGNRHAVPALRQRRGHDCGGRHTPMDGLRGRPHAASRRLTLRSRLFREGGEHRGGLCRRLLAGHTRRRAPCRNPGARQRLAARRLMTPAGVQPRTRGAERRLLSPLRLHRNARAAGTRLHRSAHHAPSAGSGGQFPTALTRLAYDRADAIANCRHCAHV